MKMVDELPMFPPDLRVRDINNKEETVFTLKTYVNKGKDILRRRHLDGASGAEIVESYTALIDRLIQTIIKETDIYETRRFRAAFAALGGYGRSELNIHSDVDMMLLYKGKLDSNIKGFIERMLYLLWDTGLDIGFSIRSLRECISLAKRDVKTKTSLIDLRFLAGDKGVFNELGRGMQRKIFTASGIKRFVAEKLEEYDMRHKKYGDSVYILEPNIKDCEGGLRDFHTALWISKAVKGISRLEELAGTSYLSDSEFSGVMEAVDFLWRVRNNIHFEDKRKMDQLTFDHQEKTARVFGYRDSANTLAVEEFMRDYYRYAFNINHYSSILIRRLTKEKAAYQQGKMIDDEFNLLNGLIVVNNENIFEKRPEAMMKAFEYAGKYGARLDSSTRDLILRNLYLVDERFRNSTGASQSFINILNYDNAFSVLKEMHTLKFLGSYIPEFKDISHRMQHDLYHVYTVDIHSLFAVKELERLDREYKGIFPVISSIYRETGKHCILKLAVLLHDIGKALGKEHALKGFLLTKNICRRMSLPEEDCLLLCYLVKNHLILADTAQYRDLHDEKLIIDFARSVGSVERLNMLYLLTFSDIRAVGPEVWTKWKDALFQELYFKAKRVLERGTFETEDYRKRLPYIRTRVSALLENEVSEGFIENYFASLPARYFLSNTPGKIAEHIRLLMGLKDKPFLIRTRQEPEREYTEVTICTIDIHGLFSMIAGVMAANNINIIGAQVYTLKNGLALDIFYTNSSLGKIITDDKKWRGVENDLDNVLSGRMPVDRVVRKRGPSLLDRRAKPPVRTFIDVDNAVSDSFTVIDIHTGDRIGLLYTIARAISNLGLYIYVAKISTKGDEAADIFYVKDIFGQKVYNAERLKGLREGLYRALGETPPDEFDSDEQRQKISE